MAALLDLADFIHECLYGFHDMKDRLENQVLQVSLNATAKIYPFSCCVVGGLGNSYYSSSEG